MALSKSFPLASTKPCPYRAGRWTSVADRILALDPGEQRIGVAVSDPVGLTAQALEVISAHPADAALARIRQLVDRFDVHEVVVGLPLNMDGSEGPAAAAARGFAQKLEAAVGRASDGPCRIVLFDERLTTAQAERTLLDADLSRRRRREVIDRLAAQILLQTYLDRRREEAAGDPVGE